MKSRKRGSLQRRTFSSYLEPATLIFPLELMTIFGMKSSSKNKLLLFEAQIQSSGGTPFTSMIRASYSASFSPGKIGYPMCNSHKIQPKLHMSISMLYGNPDVNQIPYPSLSQEPCRIQIVYKCTAFLSQSNYCQNQ